MKVQVIQKTGFYRWVLIGANGVRVAESRVMWWGVEEARASARRFAKRTRLPYNAKILKDRL